MAEDAQQEEPHGGRHEGPPKAGGEGPGSEQREEVVRRGRVGAGDAQAVDAGAGNAQRGAEGTEAPPQNFQEPASPFLYF